jgi:hypothetical protein
MKMTGHTQKLGEAFLAGEGRHGRRAADAREGLRQEEDRDDQAAGGERQGQAESAGHLHRTR